MRRKAKGTITKTQAAHVRGSGLKLEQTPHGDYITGTVDTFWGIVTVYSEGWGKDKRYRFTTLNIIINGVDCLQKFDEAYSRQYLATLAVRFATQMHEEEA